MRDIVDLSGATAEEVKAYNNSLFHLFGTLVNPVAKLEHLYYTKYSLEAEIHANANKKLAPKTMSVLIGIGIVLDVLFDNATKKIPGMTAITHNYIGGLALLILFPSLVILLYKTFEKKRTEKQNSDKMEYLSNVEQDIDNSYISLGDSLKLVPPSYCNSKALQYFYSAYTNGKVENVKEAINAYDEYMHRQKMEATQQQMLFQQEQMVATQNQISKQLTSIQRQMTYDTAMLILENRIY